MTEQELSFSGRISANIGRMSPAERIVAEYLRDHGRYAIFATADQIGSATNTSDATVVRTAKSLGFGGLLDLRRALASEVVVETNAVRNFHGRQGESAVAQVFAEAIERLSVTSRLVDEQQFAAAVDLLAGAREVLGFGLGGSGLLARYLAIRLIRMGRRARASWATGFQLADDLLGLAADDVVVLYTPSRILGEIEVVLEHASSVGARVLLISSSLGALFADRVDVTLAAPGSTTNFTGEMLAAEVLTDALLLQLASQDEARATQASERLAKLRSELVQGEDPAPRRRRRRQA